MHTSRKTVDSFSREKILFFKVELRRSCQVCLKFQFYGKRFDLDICFKWSEKPIRLHSNLQKEKNKMYYSFSPDGEKITTRLVKSNNLEQSNFLNFSELLLVGSLIAGYVMLAVQVTNI